MTDIGAALLLESIKEFSFIKNKRRKIFEIYKKELKNNTNVTIVDDESLSGHANWLFTILLDKKDFLQKKLRKVGIETNQVHFRNDRYSIFKKFIKNKKFKNMDEVEDKYLVLPIHTKMKTSDAKFIAKKINSFV